MDRVSNNGKMKKTLALDTGYDMMQTVNELTERLSEPLPEGFILKLLLVRLTKVKVCHLKEKVFIISLLYWFSFAFLLFCSLYFVF